MASNTVTIELDPTSAMIIQGLQNKARAQGISLETLLRSLDTVDHPGRLSDPASEIESRTPYQIALTEGLLGVVDSAAPAPDSPPIQTSFGDHPAFEVIIPATP